MVTVADLWWIAHRPAMGWRCTLAERDAVVGFPLHRASPEAHSHVDSSWTYCHHVWSSVAQPMENGSPAEKEATKLMC